MNGMLRCYVTGRTGSRAVYGINEHHFIKQQHYKKDRIWFDMNGIIQKTFWLHYQVHADLHSAMSDERFLERYGIARDTLLFNRKKWLAENAEIEQQSLL